MILLVNVDYAVKMALTKMLFLLSLNIIGIAYGSKMGKVSNV